MFVFVLCDQPEYNSSARREPQLVSGPTGLRTGPFVVISNLPRYSCWIDGWIRE